ncbi:MAG: tetratricopeptide repeat protein [Burkholderiaceae bacterium]
MKKCIVGLSLVLLSAVAWALPSLQQVETEVQQGRYGQAESMMREVVQAKPESAKAHYIYAEVLAHNANFTQAAQEVRQAKQLDPDIKFTDPGKFRAFEQLLQREQKAAAGAAGGAAQRVATEISSGSSLPNLAPAAAEPAPRAAGIPSWVWGAGLAVLALFLWRGFSRSRATPPEAAGPAGTGMPAAPAGFGGGGSRINSFGLGTPGAVPAPGYGAPGYGPAPAAPAPAGNGLLQTGVAVAGGVAAGMLVDQMLHSGSRHDDGGGVGTTGWNSPGQGLHDASFDSAPQSDSDQAARELERRNVDFGNGDGWDAGGGDSDSSGGSSSDDNGGGWD